jgi:hypothetical protein
MGCFSFLCKDTDKAALSTSFDGSPCFLFLLEDGIVIEEMYGNYDSYGRVFKSKEFDAGSSFHWKMDWPEVCDLMFDDDKSNGIAVLLDNDLTGIPKFIPTTRSDDDPNQGWGSEDDDYDNDLDLLSQSIRLVETNEGVFPKVKEPYHRVHN